VEATENKFKLPKNFDAENYFNDVIGIIIGGGEKVEKVEIRVTNEQQKFLRSLPLHHSQEEQVVDEWNSIFTFYLKPTFDFKQELLKYGDAVEVLKPEWLRNDFMRIAKEMDKIYNK
jgi:predicted DNA-binding transcriptional regulator YafY